MICKNCGKEIPDTALFCGYCGARQEVKEDTEAVDVEETETAEHTVKAEDGAPEAETEKTSAANEVSSESKEDKETEEKEEDRKTVPAEQEEASEEGIAESADQPEKETKGSSLGQKIRNSGAGKKVLGEDGKFTKEDFNRLSGSAASRIRSTANKVDWTEFRAFLEILKDPFSDHELAKIPTITALVIMLVLNWFIFGSFASGLIVLLLVCAGSLAIQYTGRGEEPFRFAEAVSKAVQTAFIPFLAMLAAALLGGFRLQYSTLPQIQSRLALFSILVVFALVMLTIGLIRSGKKINSWKGALIITAMYALIAYYLLSQIVSSLYTIM